MLLCEINGDSLSFLEILWFILFLRISLFLFKPVFRSFSGFYNFQQYLIGFMNILQLYSRTGRSSQVFCLDEKIMYWKSKKFSLPKISHLLRKNSFSSSSVTLWIFMTLRPDRATWCFRSNNSIADSLEIPPGPRVSLLYKIIQS